MNRTQNTIAIIVILLIFFYYTGKKRAKFGCVDLWDNIRNNSAEQIYTETYNMVENSPDIYDELNEKCAQTQENCNKVTCNYVVDYMLEKGTINLNEKDRINNCICDKII